MIREAVAAGLMLSTSFGANAQPFARAQRPIVSPDSSIAVEYGHLPGNAQDWITVVRRESPDEKYGEWFFTEGKTEGTYEFKALPAGEYEVRLYLNWPEGGYDVQDRSRVSVAVAPFVRAQADSFQSGEPVIIGYGCLPGNPQDWITVIHRDAPDDTYGEWFYTGGEVRGSHTFTGLPEGEYEIRLYLNWPDGGYTVRSRSAFKVVGPR